MKNKISKSISLLFVLSLFSVFFLRGNFALAKTSSGVAVSPPKIFLSAKPGETVTGSFVYINNTDHNQKIITEILPFSLDDKEKSNPVFQDVEGKAVTSPAQDWIKIDASSDNTVLSSGQKRINFSINVPSDAVGGEYYNAIFVTGNGVDRSGQPINGANSKIDYRIGVLTTLNVIEEKTWANTSLYDIFTSTYFLLALAIILILIAAIIAIKRKRAEEQ